MGASSVQEARAAALEKKSSYLSISEAGWFRSITSSSCVPLKYLDARGWLIHYAEKLASWNPTKERAWLPAGRKSFFYAEYCLDRKTQGCRDQETDGAVTKRPKHSQTIVASLRVFLRAWQELPWLTISSDVGTFVRCGLCDYLRLLIERCSRDQYAIRECFKDRLGLHFKFASAQRLAQSAIEEYCAQSDGKAWFMKIDKMDNTKVCAPCLWSQLATPMFKDLTLRLVIGVIGSMWHGAPTCQHHIRTVFDDTPTTGADMQCSAVIKNLHDVAESEGHLPEEFFIGADNTWKETKNQCMFWFLVWLLCVLDGTPLWKISMVFLMVGHTHDALDRFFQ